MNGRYINGAFDGSNVSAVCGAPEEPETLGMKQVRSELELNGVASVGEVQEREVGQYSVGELCLCRLPPEGFNVMPSLGG